MAENTKIEWATHTFNPWVGCTKVSPACDHCYAEGWAKRSGMVTWGAGAERRRTSVANWRMPEKWNRQAEIQFSAWERFQVDNGLSDDEMIEKHGFIKPQRPRVFCASLADVFDNAVPQEWRNDLFLLIKQTPHLDWLLLTKRVGNVMGMVPLPWISKPFQHGPNPENIYLGGWPQNVWLGATICNQVEADRDIPKLLTVPAAKRFLSMEPLLGSVDLTSLTIIEKEGKRPGVWINSLTGHVAGPDDSIDAKIDWVIVGGESGPRARPMHPEWARSLLDQCKSAGTPFLFKQWGEWSPAESISDEVSRKLSEVWIRKDGSVIDGGEVNFFSSDVALYRAGKKDAGRKLDGREWNEVPA